MEYTLKQNFCISTCLSKIFDIKCFSVSNIVFFGGSKRKGEISKRHPQLRNYYSHAQLDLVKFSKEAQYFIRTTSFTESFIYPFNIN